MERQQESEIACGLREGKTEAWQRLYDAHAERVWRLVARAMEPGCSDVTDIVQETFLAAARSARGFDPSRGSLWAWLSGIARRQVALHYRRRQRQTDRAKLSAIDASPAAVRGASAPSNPAHADPAATALRDELAHCIRDVLSQLPADYETLLVAKYIEGATIEEIAFGEEASQEAVRSKLARARRAFRRVFEKTTV
jgi:RNA polymerase sigma-70 factor (ECF subfamily)